MPTRKLGADLNAMLGYITATYKKKKGNFLEGFFKEYAMGVSKK